jgi:hypothetical protein
MYRWFLSLRYLRARKTNLIGIGGLFVGVGALILILSIMTGFLEETRRSVRGSLSDLVVSPYFGVRDDSSVPIEPVNESMFRTGAEPQPQAQDRRGRGHVNCSVRPPSPGVAARGSHCHFHNESRRIRRILEGVSPT